MPKERGLKLDFTSLLVGNICYSACQWMVVIVLAKLGTPEKVGEYAWGVALSAPIMLFTNFQLRSLVVSDLVERFHFSQYLVFRLISIIFALAIVAIAAAWGNSGERAAVVILVGASQAVELTSETFYGLMQKDGRISRISQSLIYRGILSLAAMWVTMYTTRSVAWALVALFGGRLLVLIAWDADFESVKGAVTILSPRNSNWMAALFRTALPLGIISMLVAFNANLARYVVQAYRGSAELGIYSAIGSLLSAGTLVVSACGQALFLPVAKACVNADRAEFRKRALQTAALGAALGMIGVLFSILFGPFILTHLFRPEYARYSDVLVRLMMAGTIAFIASGLGFVITAARSLGPQVPLLLMTGIATAIVSALLVPRYGLMGAANAALLASTVQLVGTGIILRRVDRRFTAADKGIRSDESLPVRAVEVEVI